MTRTSRWRVHGERTLYSSPWVRLGLIDVEPPGGERYEHHVVRATADAAACLVLSEDAPGADVLMLWRHRVVTDRWGWEVPAGRLEAGETPVGAAVRETFEETGWRVRDPREVLSFHPIGGIGDQRFHVVVAVAGALEGAHDPREAEAVEWHSPADVRRLIAAGDVNEGLTLVTLLGHLAGVSGPGAPAAGSPGS